LKGSTSPSILDAFLNEVDIKEQVELKSVLNTVEIKFKKSLIVDTYQELTLKMKQ
jgi:hypothetical protein